MVREVRLEECRRGKATVYEKLRKRCGMILVDVKSRFDQKKDAQTRKKVRHASTHAAWWETNAVARVYKMTAHSRNLHPRGSDRMC